MKNWHYPSLVAQTVKRLAYNAGDLGSIPGSGRSSGKGNGNPFQYCCLENPMDREAWWATVHEVAKSRTVWLHFHFSLSLVNENHWLIQGILICLEFARSTKIMWLKNRTGMFLLRANSTNIRDKENLCFRVKQHVLTGTTMYNIHHRESIAKQGKAKL